MIHNFGYITHMMTTRMTLLGVLGWAAYLVRAEGAPSITADGQSLTVDAADFVINLGGGEPPFSVVDLQRFGFERGHASPSREHGRTGARAHGTKSPSADRRCARGVPGAPCRLSSLPASSAASPWDRPGLRTSRSPTTSSILMH